MNTIINIAHPKLISKPPICSNKSTSKNESLKEPGGPYSKELESNSVTMEMFKTIQKELSKPTNDCNQNVIEPNSCSFEQLCSMINDLEQNMSDNLSVLSKENAEAVPLKYQSQVSCIL